MHRLSRFILLVASLASLSPTLTRADDATDPALLQLRSQAAPLFESAAREFSVPADLLRAYAFVHTRWTIPVVTDDPAHTPPIYGIMGLHDGREGWFVDQIDHAAQLLGVPADLVRHTSVRLNVE